MHITVLFSVAQYSSGNASEVRGIGKGGGDKSLRKRCYRSSKWWEVKDWSESVCNLIIIKKKSITGNCKHYYLAWGVLPFVHVVKILIFLVCIVASFKLSGL